MGRRRRPTSMSDPARSRHGSPDERSSGMIVRMPTSSRRLAAALIPLPLAAASAQPPEAGELTAVPTTAAQRSERVEEPGPQNPRSRPTRWTRRRRRSSASLPTWLPAGAWCRDPRRRTRGRHAGCCRSTRVWRSPSNQGACDPDPNSGSFVAPNQQAVAMPDPGRRRIPDTAVPGCPLRTVLANYGLMFGGGDRRRRPAVTGRCSHRRRCSSCQ
jgi:hypothetical protein